MEEKYISRNLCSHRNEYTYTYNPNLTNLRISSNSTALELRPIGKNLAERRYVNVHSFMEGRRCREETNASIHPAFYTF